MIGKHCISIERKMQNRRNRQGVGYAVFYGILLAGFTFVATLSLRNFAGNLPFNVPRFLYDSVIGIQYVYNGVSLSLLCVTAIFFPRPFHIQALYDNSWNMLCKFGVKPGKLMRSHIFSNLFSLLFSYGFGYVVSFGIAFFTANNRALDDVKTLVFLIAVGVFSILIMSMPVVAVGAASKSKALLSLIALLGGGVVAYLLYRSTYHLCAETQQLADSTAKLISLSPFGLVIIGCVFFILFFIIAVVSATSRIKRYNVEDQDEEDLVDLGVTENMLIMTRGRSRFHVAISGPDIHNSDVAVSVPPLEESSPS